MKVTVRYRGLQELPVVGVLADHSRNHSFLMDASGEWKLSPAYDMTRSGYALGSGFRAAGILGRYAKLGLKDLRELAASQGLRKADDLIAGVLEAVQAWPDFAVQAGLSETEAELLRDEFPATRW